MRAELSTDRVTLPPPQTEGGPTLAEAMAKRRSCRSFAPGPLDLAQIGQLLYAAQGRNRPRGRTAPSAGATFPLELYLACEEGFFHYEPADHSLARVTSEDLRLAFARASHNQGFIAAADVVLFFAAVCDRTTARYHERGIRYVHMDVGHAAENVLLQAAAWDLGAVPVGAFEDDALAAAAGLPEGQVALYMVPIGRPAERSAG